MLTVEFENNDTFLPITMKQFEELTNELLIKMNEAARYNATEEQKGYDANYFAQILMSAIHSLDHKFGKVKKTELFENCLNRISCHLTYNIINELQARLKTEAAAKGETTPTTTTDNVISLGQNEEHA